MNENQPDMSMDAPVPNQYQSSRAHESYLKQLTDAPNDSLYKICGSLNMGVQISLRDSKKAREKVDKAIAAMMEIQEEVRLTQVQMTKDQEDVDVFIWRREQAVAELMRRNLPIQISPMRRPHRRALALAQGA